MPRHAVLPFTLRRTREVLSAGSYTATTETVHGILRLEGGTLTVQWRLARRTDTYGSEIRSDEELEAVRQVELPITAVGNAVVRHSWWNPFTGHRLVLTGSDLRAFDALTGSEGLQSSHPAEIRLRIRRGDRLAAEEFAAELALARAERALSDQHAAELPPPRPDPSAGSDPAEAEG